MRSLLTSWPQQRNLRRGRSLKPREETSTQSDPDSRNATHSFYHSRDIKTFVASEPKRKNCAGRQWAKRQNSISSSTTIPVTTTTTLATVKTEPSEPFLSEVTILVSKKLEQVFFSISSTMYAPDRGDGLQQQSTLHDLVASMGGSFAYMFDTSITHLIFGIILLIEVCGISFVLTLACMLDGRADASKELRLAKAHKHIKIVSPMWLHAVSLAVSRKNDCDLTPFSSPQVQAK